MYKMKNKILISVVLFSAFFFKMNGQNLKNDVVFFKSTTFVYSSLNSFEEIYNADDQKTVKKEMLPILQKNVSKLSSLYEEVKQKYSNDTDFKEFELWIQAISQSYEYLKNNDDTWMLGFTLIKMNVNDFVNSKY